MANSILHASELGEGFPVLIIHGWEMNGMGTTPAGDNIKNLDDMFLRLVQFIDSRLGDDSGGGGKPTKFLLIGTSCGGYLAHALAQKYTDQVDGVLLRVPVVEPEDAKCDLDKGGEGEGEGDAAAAATTTFKHSPDFVKSLNEKVEKMVRPAQQAADHAVLDPIRADPARYRLSSSLISLENDKNAAKFNVSAPALIISGRHDDVVGYRDSLRLLESYPRSTYAVLDRAKHGLPVAESEIDLFQALVSDWLARVVEWQAGTDSSNVDSPK